MTTGQDEFSRALRAAIEKRGITLERLCDRLRRLETPVSTATLSYWQSGRTRPERPASLEALRNLEAIVGVPSGDLAALLEPPKPRGRVASRPRPAVVGSAFFPEAETVEHLLRGLDLSHDGGLTRLSGHDRIHVGADQSQDVRWTRQVLRAEEHGIDRIVVIHEADFPCGDVPDLRAVRNCRVGRVHADKRQGLVAAELVFPRALARHETILIEHEVTEPSPRPSFVFERRCRTPVREFLMEVRFDPRALPARCVRYSVLDGVEKSRPVELDEDRTAHHVVLDFGPGQFGVRWEWPPDGTGLS